MSYLTTVAPTWRRLLTVTISLTVAVMAMQPSRPPIAGANRLSAPTYTSRLLGVNWQQAAGRDLDCRVPGLGLEPPTVRYHDITGDGFPDSFVVLRCHTGDSSAFDQLAVFDGASSPAHPRRLGILIRTPRSHEYTVAIRTGMKIQTVSFSGFTASTTGRMFRVQGGSICPGILARQNATWDGHAFQRGRLVTIRVDPCS